MRPAALLVSLLVAAAASCAPSSPNGGSTASAAATAAVAPSTVVYLVRHAEKVDASRDPLLSAAGEARAAALAEALRDAGVQAVVTTQYQRTRLTAAPLTRSRGLTPEVVEAGTGATHAAEVARVVRERHASETVLVVGHSNSVPAIIAALGGPKLPELCDAEYSRLFVLVIDGSGPARLTRASYGAPDAPDAAGCAAMRSR